MLTRTHACLPVSSVPKEDTLRTRKFLLLGTYLVTCREGKELSQAPQQPNKTSLPAWGSAPGCVTHLPTSLCAGSARPAPAQHPPGLEHNRGRLRGSLVQRGCPRSPVLPGASGAELKWQREQLIFQGLGRDVITLLGTSSLHLQPSPALRLLPSALPSQAGYSF